METNVLKIVIDLLQTGKENFLRNFWGIKEQLDLLSTIRVIVIVGGYLLIRPYFVKLGNKYQTKQHEKELDAEEMAKAEKGRVTANSFRGKVEIPEDSESEEEVGTGKDVNWGKKARKRQRQHTRRLLEAEERLRKEQQEDDEDKDIQEFLHD